MMPGMPLEGGFYAGRILIAGVPYGLIVAPKAEGEREGAEQAFADEWYWSSTQHAAVVDGAWSQVFDDGSQDNYDKSANLRARAVRRFAI